MHRGSEQRGFPARCRAIAESNRFQLAIMVVIVLNAIMLGVETYPAAVEAAGNLFEVGDRVFLTIFVIELAIRIAAYGRHPQRFFTKGWNIFDFTIVAATFVPGIGANVTALRILRVLRVVRLVELIGDLRIIVRGVLRSLLPLAGVASLVVILLYIYAIIGNALFGEALPDDWGTVGSAMLSCFQVLTLDNWDDLFFPAQEVSALAVPFFLSFILMATFVVMNVVIAVVVNSVESARQAQLEENAALVGREIAEHAPALADRILAMRMALDELEAQLHAESRDET
ncbi:MAG: ion transporter [Acidimicrobiia bacterium]|nr:ion transporter [Acidimicrobiia bacterium]